MFTTQAWCFYVWTRLRNSEGLDTKTHFIKSAIKPVLISLLFTVHTTCTLVFFRHRLAFCCYPSELFLIRGESISCQEMKRISDKSWLYEKWDSHCCFLLTLFRTSFLLRSQVSESPSYRVTGLAIDLTTMSRITLITIAKDHFKIRLCRKILFIKANLILHMNL